MLVSESAPTALGSWKFTQLGGFSARQELLSFPRKPDFYSSRSWGWSSALHPCDLRQRRTRALATPPPPGCFPPLLSLLYGFYVAFRVEPGCNSRSLPSVWCRPWRGLCALAGTARWVHGLWRGLCSPVATAESWASARRLRWACEGLIPTAPDKGSSCKTLICCLQTRLWGMLENLKVNVSLASGIK